MEYELCMKPIQTFITCLLSVSLSAALYAQPHPDYTYGCPDTPWAESFGNHRAVLHVDRPAEAVRLDFQWRRPDKDVDKRRFLVVHAASGDTVPHILRHEVDNECCRISFGPVTEAGTYYFYYLPYRVQPGSGSYYCGYLQPEKTPPTDWLAAIRTADDCPQARVERVEARSTFDSFFPMEVIATEAEVAQYCKDNPCDTPFCLFPEDRKRPIRMLRHLPVHWMDLRQGKEWTGTAAPNEYYVFQVGVWSPVHDVQGLSYRISGLTNGTVTWPATSVTCFNLEGINPDGEYFRKQLDVEKGHVQALWFGVDIPREAPAGDYKGMLTISDKAGHRQSLPICIRVEGIPLEDRGDSEPWRHSRLRWLNSTLGMADTPTQPYTAVRMEGNRFECLGRSVTLNRRTGLPEQICSWGNEVLAAPLRFVIETAEGIKRLKGAIRVQEQTEGHVTTAWQAEDEDLLVSAKATCEFDGWVNYIYTLTPKRPLQVKDIRLELEVKNEIARQFLGAGLPGQDTPDSYEGKWDTPEKTVDNHGVSIPVSTRQNWLWPFDSFWIGNAHAGVHCELRGSVYTGPLLNAYRPPYPESWHNGGQGGFRLQKGKKSTVVTVYSGGRGLEEGRPLTFDFALLLTPVKPLDLKSQFDNRYYHNGSKPVPTDADVKAGVKVINIHHANEYNPFINYPFLSVDKMKEFTRTWHAKGVKVKLYYTLRELTSAATEIWAIRSLGDEILRGGQGGGFPWLCEHFVTGYTPQWYHHFDRQEMGSYAADAAVLTTESDSRWYNYYIEGLRWMIREMDIDGIYLDDVSFGRDILKRMRRAMESVKPGCIIDLHSNTGFSHGPANQYAEFFPYIDKVWFGESFLYDQMTPANWLVESSGIPFGLMGDMLYRGGNKWLGMQYGMTVRHPWETEGIVCDPRVVWKVWDDFGIADARMSGFWEPDAAVTATDEAVKVTAYERKGRVLLSIGNYSDTLKHVRLHIDRKRLCLKGKNYRLRAPEIPTFQLAGEWGMEEEIPVKPRKGWLLLLEEEK